MESGALPGMNIRIMDSGALFGMNIRVMDSAGVTRNEYPNFGYTLGSLTPAFMPGTQKGHPISHGL